MTTTVQRGKSGALLRIPSGALRMKPVAEHALHFVIAFIDESTPYYDPAFEWDDPRNADELMTWRLDVASLNGAVQALRDEDRLQEFNLGVIKVNQPPNLPIRRIKPPMEPFPPFLLGNPPHGGPYLLERYPTLDQFLGSVTFYGGDTEPDRPITETFIDSSGSMTSAELQPGLRDYITTFGDINASFPTDERWVRWFKDYIVDNITP